MGEQPKEEREGGAEEEASDDGEIESGVFTTMNDVARKAAEAEREFATKVEESTDEGKKASNQEESASEFAKGVHNRILLQAVDRPFPGPLPVIQQIHLTCIRLLYIDYYILIY